MKTIPEAEFLIRCCRLDTSQDWAGLRQRAAAVRDWDSVIRLSADNGIAPLVLHVFKALAESGSMPERAAGELRKVAVLDVARVVRLRSALREILPPLHRSGAGVIILKGLVLGPLLYDDPGLRPSRDIDLMCKEEDYERVRDTMVSLGYETDASPKLSPREAQLESHFDRHFFHPDGLVHVELHLDSMKLGVRAKHLESMWTRALPVEIEGAPALAAAPEDQLLTLSVHLHRHGFNRLIWFKDIDLLIRRYGGEFDWKRIVSEARAEGAAVSLWYIARVLRKMFGTPFPRDAISQLTPNPFIRWTFARIWPESRVLSLRSLTKRRAVQFTPSESWRGIIPSLLLMGRRRDKMGLLLRRLLPF